LSEDIYVDAYMLMLPSGVRRLDSTSRTHSFGPHYPVGVSLTNPAFPTRQADIINDDADISCGYPLDQFLTAAIVNSYLLLAVFGWSFLGFETHFSIRGRRRRFLRPFSSLSFVALLYLLLFIMSATV